MKRPNSFAVRSLSETGEQLLWDLLDASAVLWNETNYERLMQNNDDGYADEDVCKADTECLKVVRESSGLVMTRERRALEPRGPETVHRRYVIFRNGHSLPSVCVMLTVHRDFISQ